MLRPNRSLAAWVCFTTALFTLYAPQTSWAFLDEDVWITSGIIAGITLGVCLVVVLIAGTVSDIRGEPEDAFADTGLGRLLVSHSGLLEPGSPFQDPDVLQPGGIVIPAAEQRSWGTLLGLDGRRLRSSGLSPCGSSGLLRPQIKAGRTLLPPASTAVLPGPPLPFTYLADNTQVWHPAAVPPFSLASGNASGKSLSASLTGVYTGNHPAEPAPPGPLF